MRLSLALIFGFLILFPDFYIWFSFIRKKLWYSNLLYLFPFIAAVLSTALWFGGCQSVWPAKVLMLIIVCLCLPKLIFALLSILGRICGKFWKKAPRKFDVCALVLSVMVCVAMIYGCTFGKTNLQVNRQSLRFSALPAEFEGYRIVQISDLHLGTMNADARFVQRIVDSVNAQHPDLVVFTGDLVNIRAEEVEPFKNALSQLRATDGVLAILGNHDYGTYGRYRTADGEARNLAKLIAMEAELGWRMLLDRHVVISRGEGRLAVIGTQHIGRPPFPHKGDLKKARNGLSDSTFQILLTHDPSHWRLEVVEQTPIALTLSGHTHAMQFQIGSFSPVMWKYPEWGGLYEAGEQKLFVSVGLGGTIPFRLGASPEICVLDLKRR